jgi:tol-pal system protein YbgF
MRRLIATAVLCTTWAACFYPASRGRALEDRIALEQEELREIRKKLEETLPKIDAKIGEVTKALEGLDRAAHRSGADIGVRLQKTIEDLGQLRGQVDTYLFKIGELEKGLKKLEEDTDQRLTELQGSEATKAAAARKKAEDLPKPTDKRQFLSLADTKAKEGDTLLARQLYAEFLKKWPRDELVGEAHYGLGETFFSEEKCREALSEYGKVIKEYSKTRSAPNAYLRSGQCFGRLNMKDESRLFLEEVVKNYPKSDAAKEAKVQLAELDKAKRSRSGKKK